jgi:alpha-tubulin suppressor-like RCC1 family protein
MRGNSGSKESRSQSPSWPKTWIKSLGIVATLLASSATVQAAGKSASEAEFGQFIVEGKIANAVQVEIGVYDSAGKMVDGTTLLSKDGVFDGTLPLPLGFNVDVRMQAYDAYGKAIAQGASSAYFNDMTAGAVDIIAATKNLSTLGGIEITPFKLQLTSEIIGEASRQYYLSGIDAYGKEVAINPENVQWSIPFPEHMTFLPCKAGGPSVACIEFTVPNRANPYVAACVKDMTCRYTLGTVDDKPLGYKAITAGGTHTCALTVNNEVFCFGGNLASQLGRVTTDTCRFASFQPFSVPCDPTPKLLQCANGQSCVFTSIDAGLNHTCGIDSSSRVWCWGSNDHGQAGLVCGTSNANCLSMLQPQLVSVPSSPTDLFPKFVQVSAGEQHTCALSTRGNIFCWGENSLSQAGGTSGRSPHQVISKSLYKQVAAGREHSCAVTIDGEVECWGENRHKQIQPGLLATANFPDPTPVRAFHPALVGIVDRVTVSTMNTCAQAQGTGLLCWGAGSQNDALVSQATTSDVEMGYHDARFGTSTCAIDSASIQCARVLSSLLPVTGSPQSIRDVTVGQSHSCLVRTNGEAFCWGEDNFAGQMGDGTKATHQLPARVLGP